MRAIEPQSYVAYGLRIRSEIVLPELTISTVVGGADVDFRFASVTGPLPGPDCARLTEFDVDGAYFAWPWIGRFRIAASGVVTIDPLTEDLQAIRFALLGPVLAAILQIRGLALLHGSAIAHGGKAILMLGRKGAGKSTLAAAFVANGGEILNDDVLPIRLVGEAAMIIAGFPAVKLTTKARDLLFRPGDERDCKIAVGDEKHFVSLSAPTVKEFDVAAVVIIDPERPVKPIPVPSFDALQEVLQHGYSLKFGERALRFGQDKALFAVCAHLAQQRRVIRTGRPNDMARIRPFADSLLSACLT